MRLLPVFTCAALISLAGCADDGPGVDDGPQEPAAAEGPEAYMVTGGGSMDWLAAVGVPGTGVDVQLSASNAVAIDVPDGATHLTATIDWTCAAPCGLHLYLRSPAGTDADHAFADAGPATVEASDPAPGAWHLIVHADAVALDFGATVDWTVEGFGDAGPEGSVG